MKKQTLAACVCAAIALLMFSCGWFGKSKHYVSEKNIIGKWKIDSVNRSLLSQAEEDPINGLLFSKPKYDDSLPVTIAFAHDSTYTMYNYKDSSFGSNKYYFDSAAQKLFVKEGSLSYFGILTVLGEGTIEITFPEDGSYYIMKKQP